MHSSATADSFTSVVDGVARDLNVDNALNLADQAVMGMYVCTLGISVCNW